MSCTACQLLGKLVWSTVSIRHWSPQSIILPGTPVAAYWSNIHCKPLYRWLAEKVTTDKVKFDDICKLGNCTVDNVLLQVIIVICNTTKSDFLTDWLTTLNDQFFNSVIPVQVLLDWRIWPRSWDSAIQDWYPYIGLFFIHIIYPPCRVYFTSWY